MVPYHLISAPVGKHIKHQCRGGLDQLFELCRCRAYDLARVSTLSRRKIDHSRHLFRLGDIINKFRSKSLGLDPLSIRSGPGIVDRLKVPSTYCFSPSVVPKPLDWKNHIGLSLILVLFLT